MKFCVDCKHHDKLWQSDYSTMGERRFERHYCAAVLHKRHPVTGENLALQYCDIMRWGGPCGIEGNLYEAKDT